MDDGYRKHGYEKPLVLASVDDLQAFAARIHPLALDLPGRIDLQLPLFSPENTNNWNARLQRHLRACGCFTGAVCTLLALAYCIATPFWSIGGFGSDGWRRFALPAGFVVLAGFMGKIAALVVAKLLLRRDIRRLLAVIEGETNHL